MAWTCPRCRQKWAEMPPHRNGRTVREVMRDFAPRRLPATPANVLAMQPVLLPTAYGTWLAVTAATAPLGIGFAGDTKAEAIERFAQGVKDWAKLCSPTVGES